MALTPEQILNIAGTPAAIPGSYIYSVAQAIEAEVRKEYTELIRQMRDALESAKPVYATSKNTTAVALSYEAGGYVKHYTILPHIHHAAIAAANARLEGETCD